MTTKRARSRWRTTRSAAIAAQKASASCLRVRPSKQPQGEGDRLGKVARIGGREIVVGVRHPHPRPREKALRDRLDRGVDWRV